jgi:hypothetical protein
MVTTIMQGFTDWLTSISQHSQAPTFSSLLGPDVILTAAYYEQFHQIGWSQFCLRRLRLKWAKAIAAYKEKGNQRIDSNNWTSHLVSLIWQFTKQMWNYCNQIVHGATKEDAVRKIMQQLQDQVSYHYCQYENNSAHVLPCHDYLFEQQHPLDVRLQMSYETLKCWLRSIEEALSTLQFQDNLLQESSMQFYSLS